MTIKFETIYKLHQTVYTKTQLLSPKESRLQRSGWVWVGLSKLAHQSKQKPLQNSAVTVILDTLKRISENVAWIRHANIRFDQVDLESAIRTLEALDAAVDELDISLEEKARRASKLRLQLQRILIAAGIPRSERVAVQYRPMFPSGRGVPRKMISDLKTAPSAEAEHPISALPHRSVKELVVDERKRRERDLKRIETAAFAEIKEHEARFAAIESLLGAHPSGVSEKLEHEIGLAREMLPEWMVKTPPQELAAAYFQLLNDGDFWRRRQSSRLKAPGSQIIWNFLDLKLSGPLPRYRLVETLVRVMPPQIVLTACLVLIQAHTGWNVNSVLEMKRNMVIGDRGRYSIQGFKSRTKDLTPIVEVNSASPEALVALEFLVARHNWLIKHGWITALETRLWLNPVSIQNDPVPKQYVGWGSSLHTFIEKHSLPKFSFEQIRVQKLSLISLSAAGVQGAKETAGHLELSTTGHYLEQEILLRLRSAMNLEFQRRVEAAVTYDFSKVDERQGGDARYLLRDIGDGASCQRPASPPWESELLDGECRAEKCHEGNGCPNRTIRITPEALEAAVRMSRFYAGNWSRIAIDNPEHFKKTHLPHLIFNQALLHAIRLGPYRDRLHAMEKAIAEEAT